jgi:Glycosyl transferase family 2
VRQFIFLDDRSADGTREYLSDQADCAIITSELTYGQYVDGKKADVIWRSEIPRAYCERKWVLVVDADEFIELPPQMKQLSELTAVLDNKRASAVGAVMVDFYPAHARDLEDGTTPGSRAELLSRYPYFDGCPHGHWLAGKNKFEQVYGGVRDRLLEAQGIAHGASTRKMSVFRNFRKQLQRFIGIEKRKHFNALHKVPLVRWSSELEYLSSHMLNRAPCRGVQLPLMHFKFTGSIFGKVHTAIGSGAYHRQSAEYLVYDDLLSAMLKSDASFLGQCSRSYGGAQDFVDCGISFFDGPGLAAATE